ncbi:MAG TPA: magnesium chelatase subunit H [Acetobacteraceae bacterium]|nr:magnesium chelatase subunit H [Acetobacteraceae bacterium]
MPKRISAADAPALRVVVVTMDSHLAATLDRARLALAGELPGLALTLHAADQWGDDAAALARCRADIEAAHIVVVTMLFLDEHIRAVYPALTARRDTCDAMLCCLSAGEVVKLTRLGRFSMSGEAAGVIALLKRLRGRTGTGSSGRGQMRMLRQIPALLRFIPGTAQDMRNYFIAMQYWLAGSAENLAGLVRLLAARYAAARVPGAAPLRIEPPRRYPDVGLYHPALAGAIAEDPGALPARAEAVGTVGVLVMRSHVLAGNTAHYDGVIAALEARGLRVIPAFASGLDARPAIDRFFRPPGGARIDALLSLTGFSLVGGPAYNDAGAAQAALAALDVPYVVAHPLEFQTLEQWQAGPCGLAPVEATMMVAIPELDGAICPMTFGGRSAAAAGHAHAMTAHAERAGALAARVARLVALRRKCRAERRVGIVLFNFPPNAGTVGTAAYLSVFASLHNTLRALRDGGYRVELPDSAEALCARIVDGNATRFGTPANVAARIPADAHYRREPHVAEIERQWGRAPGRHQTDGRSLFVLGAEFGNVFVGVQPAFGHEGDPMRMLFAQDAAPTHAFAAFYTWLRTDFAADVVLHFGTHGALEFMPGKQAGLSGACWPDRLIGDLPNVYLYASNNPSEGTLAKRRGYATLVSHLTPPVAQAGLYRGLRDLKASLDRWRLLPPDAHANDDTDADADSGADAAAALAGLIQAQASAVNLAAAEPAWPRADRAAEIERLGVALYETEAALIPHGLHVVGAPPDAAARAQMLDAAGIADPTRRAELDRLLGTDHELPALLHALDGGFIRPAPGADLLRNADVLPTGRNLHGFDPFRIPSTFAMQDGAAQAERLLARCRADGGTLPETVALVLWGSDNIKTEGGPIAQALWLIGAAPRLDSYGRLCGAALLPLAQLGRPRIDVLITLSGIFRDLLPMQTRLLAEAALLAAGAEEPDEQNFIRKHARAFMAVHGGDLEQASLRIFGNADAAYGANVNLMLDHGGWQDEAELAEAFVRRKGFAYGVRGRPQRQERVLAHLLRQVDATYQNLDSVELGVTTIDHYFDSLGGISRAVGRARGAMQPVYIGDQTTGAGKVRSLTEQVALETRTRTLNPGWYEPLLAHGREGVRHIESHVSNTLGWSATTGQVAPWVYQTLAETYLLDAAMRDRLVRLNPAASARIANRLLEAQERRYWSPDAATLESLRRAGEDLEDRLEGVGVEAAA